MYVTRQTKFVDVVVSAGNFNDFLVGLDLVKRVGAKDANLVSNVKAARAALVAERQELADRKAQQEQAKQQMADSKATVEAALGQAKGKLASVEQQIREAMARQLAEAAAARSRSGAVASRVPYPYVRNTMPPGTPHPGVVNVAYDQLGKPYVWGATGPNSFDCSGLTTYCYRVGANMEIPRSSYDQANLPSVSISQIQPGDIVGFHGWGHVGMYIGNDQFIQAPRTGDVVKITQLSSRGDFAGATRP